MTREIADIEDELAQLRLDHGDARMVTPEECAEVSGLHINTVRKLCRDGRFRTAVETRGRWLVDLKEVEEYRPGVGAVTAWKRIDGRICPAATNEEIDFLRSHQDWTGPELAAHLGHSIDWVRDRRMFMRRLEGEEAWPKRLFSAREKRRKGREEADKVCDLAREGETLAGIVAKTGLNMHIVRSILRENHVRTAGQIAMANGGNATAALARVKNLRAEGKSWRKIAEATGLPMSTCRHLAVQSEIRGPSRVEQRRAELHSEILDLVIKTGGCNQRAIITGLSSYAGDRMVCDEIGYLIRSGRLTETRTATARILTIPAGEVRPAS